MTPSDDIQDLDGQYRYVIRRSKRMVQSASEQPVESLAKVRMPRDQAPNRKTGPSVPRSIIGAVFSEEYALPMVWAALVVLFAFLPATDQQFRSLSTYAVIAGVQSVTIVLGLAVLIPMLGGDYDLSTAYTLTLSSMVIALLTTQEAIPVGLAVVIVVVMGALIGLVNGLVCALFDIDSFIVTLGSGTLIAGITLWVSKEQIVTGVPSSLSNFFVDKWLGFPLQFYYSLALCLLVWWWLRFMRSGRRLMYMGQNRAVASLSGVKVVRVRIVALVTSGVISSLAGVMYVAQSGSASPTGGQALLLAAFAAVFLGATTITPGRYNAWGSAVAVLFLGTGITGLQIVGLADYVQQLFYGAALVGAVVVARVVARRRSLAAEREALNDVLTRPDEFPEIVAGSK